MAKYITKIEINKLEEKRRISYILFTKNQIAEKSFKKIFEKEINKIIQPRLKIKNSQLNYIITKKIHNKIYMKCKIKN